LNTELFPALKSAVRKNSPFLDYIRYSEFKRLLGQLAMMVDRDGMKTIAVLSEHSGEGKTFLVSAMALGYASLLDRRVLIVDTVVRNEGHSLFLKKIYEEQLEYAPFLGGPKTHVTRMIELISPEQREEDDSVDTADFRIGTYVNSIKDNYDLILVDTCALSASNKRNIDPVIVARQADASILITSDRSMNRESLQRVKGVMAQWHVRIVGVIHNAGIGK
jgi:Mrp family chromosome partitioning ATPase